MLLLSVIYYQYLSGSSFPLLSESETTATDLIVYILKVTI